MIYLDKDEQKLLENLKKQYDENLTEEQKHALIRYNSSLFLFYNKIMSIEDYANKSIEELYTIMKPFIEQNEFYLKNLTYFMCDTDYYNDDEELRKILAPVLDKEVLKYDIIIERCRNPYTLEAYDRVSEEYTMKEMIRILVEQGILSQDKLQLTDYFELQQALDDLLYKYCEKAREILNILTNNRLEIIYKRLITNVLKDLKTIKNIPESAITLPEDITVYRGVRTDEDINNEQLSESDFVSTSLFKSVAMEYITRREGTNNRLYTIKLSKGEPVFIFPQTVQSEGGWGYILRLTEDVRIYEIMFDKTRVKNMKIINEENLLLDTHHI